MVDTPDPTLHPGQELAKHQSQSTEAKHISSGMCNWGEQCLVQISSCLCNRHGIGLYNRHIPNACQWFCCMLLCILSVLR